MCANIGVALKTNLMSSLLSSAVIFKCAFSAITLRILNLNNKIQKIFAIFCTKDIGGRGSY